MILGKTMMLVTGFIQSNKNATNEVETFKLIPVSERCPFNEAFFDPETQILHIISKQKKLSFASKNTLEKIERYYEHEIIDPFEIKNFIGTFATNDGVYNFNLYLKD